MGVGAAELTLNLGVLASRPLQQANPDASRARLPALSWHPLPPRARHRAEGPAPPTCYSPPSGTPGACMPWLSGHRGLSPPCFPVWRDTAAEVLAVQGPWSAGQWQGWCRARRKRQPRLKPWGYLQQDSLPGRLSLRFPVLVLPDAEPVGPVEESLVLLSCLFPSLSREEAPLRRRLFCNCNFLQRRPVPSCPAHSGRQLRQAGWGERPWLRFRDAAEGPAGTTARKTTCTTKYRDTQSRGGGRLLGSYKQSCKGGAVLRTHLVALHPQLVPGCTTRACKDKSCSRVKSCHA